MATFNEKKTCSQRMENFQRFIWNPDAGELMGRTLINWVWISLYYVAFYCIMSCLFALALYVMLSTLNPYTPTYQDRLHAPGVMVRPDVFGEEGVQIFFNLSEKSSWERHVKTLQDFLSVYNKSVQFEKNCNCTRGKYYFQDSFKGPDHTKYACRFIREMLGNCSGLQDPTFGYKVGQPCFIIRMNRIINFLPGNGTAPYVNCTKVGGHSLGETETFPVNGTFDLSYFPYYGKKAQPNYTNPLIAVKFLNLERNKEITVECKVIGKEIITDNPHDPYEGKVLFRVKICD
ncbi:potassium-transporting ATPase subunit beta [Latimeria chalumnae]|uniref:potassium-transporting ATPase subunit beta n=1 Tax=Latimeria chalumnae TaxID=7897 RepID=UPI0003C1A6C9|nr:PREDICTED: potassium-transporting ATPase subunit beta [Latimeria chalumnae]|eukprot:XP_005998136.1 PREDICTED: potassium-transporting ATPase subunit beta [Latimeria chalumnae]